MAFSINPADWNVIKPTPSGRVPVSGISRIERAVASWVSRSVSWVDSVRKSKPPPMKPVEVNG